MHEGASPNPIPNHNPNHNPNQVREGVSLAASGLYGSERVMLVSPQPAGARDWNSADTDGAAAGLVLTPVRRSKRAGGPAKGGVEMTR